MQSEPQKNARRKRSLPTINRLKELLSYDPLTGEFTWKIDGPGRNAAKAGTKAGHVRSRGYLVICIDGTSLFAHRIAWAMTHGEWPTNTVDHRDTNPSNNRLLNLRLATHSQNSANRNTPTDNTSGVKGVRKRKNRYQAAIRVGGKYKFLGSFLTEQEARDAYNAAASQHFGDFARAS